LTCGKLHDVLALEICKDTLPAGIRSRRVDNNNGLTMHLLEAGFEIPGRRCVVLLHGFPELADRRSRSLDG